MDLSQRLEPADRPVKQNSARLSPTADSPRGGRRKAHVRDVLVALGGSPEELDRPNDGADQDATLGSRLDAYTRLARNRPAAVVDVPEPKAAPVAVARRTRS